MQRFGRRWIVLMAAGAALVGGFASASDMPAVTGSSAGSGQVAAHALTDSQIAMDMMRKGRAADALALLEPAAQRFAAVGAGSKARCAQDGVDLRGKTVLDAETCNALFLRAFALTELGRRADAIEALQQLTRLAPDTPRYVVELAFAQRASGDKDAALATYTKAVSIASRPATVEANKRYRAAALRGIGYLLADKGDWIGGEKAYLASLIDDPESKIAISELAYIARKRAASEAKGG